MSSDAAIFTAIDQARAAGELVKVYKRRCDKGHLVEAAYSVRGNPVVTLSGFKRPTDEGWAKVPRRAWLALRAPDDEPRGCRCGPEG